LQTCLFILTTTKKREIATNLSIIQQFYINKE